MNMTTTVRNATESTTERSAPTLACSRGARVVAAIASVVISTLLLGSVVGGMTSMADAPAAMAAGHAAPAARG